MQELWDEYYTTHECIFDFEEEEVVLEEKMWREGEEFAKKEYFSRLEEEEQKGNKGRPVFTRVQPDSVQQWHWGQGGRAGGQADKESRADDREGALQEVGRGRAEWREEPVFIGTQPDIDVKSLEMKEESYKIPGSVDTFTPQQLRATPRSSEQRSQAVQVGDNYKWWWQNPNFKDPHGCLEGKYKPFEDTPKQFDSNGEIQI